MCVVSSHCYANRRSSSWEMSALVCSCLYFDPNGSSFFPDGSSVLAQAPLPEASASFGCRGNSSKSPAVPEEALLPLPWKPVMENKANARVPFMSHRQIYEGAAGGSAVIAPPRPRWPAVGVRWGGESETDAGEEGQQQLSSDMRDTRQAGPPPKDSAPREGRGSPGTPPGSGMLDLL